jgi:hypothetical protein
MRSAAAGIERVLNPSKNRPGDVLLGVGSTVEVELSDLRPHVGEYVEQGRRCGGRVVQMTEFGLGLETPREVTQMDANRWCFYPWHRVMMITIIPDDAATITVGKAEERD